MSASLMRDAIVYSKYAHNIVGTGRRETWEEATDRMMGMHYRKFKKLKDPRIGELLGNISHAIKQYKIMPSMRALQNGGKGIESKNSRMYNCAFTHIDRHRALIELFWMLLSGCGTGFSVQEHHIAKLNEVIQPYKSTITWIIEDSIEGWAYALGALLASFNLVDENVVLAADEQLLAVRGHVVRFDYSKIRDKGSILSTSNGLAPGPDGLRTALELIRKLLMRVKHARRLVSVEISDIALMSSDAVMSGGVRRSASIILFSPWDMGMITYKATADWYVAHPWRARANISALLLRNADEQYVDRIKEFSKAWGEPGVVWTNSREMGTNPCVPGYVRLQTPNGWKPMEDIQVGDQVWGPDGWTNVVRKMNNGIKEVIRHHLSATEYLDLTPNHKIMQPSGEKEEIQNTELVCSIVNNVKITQRIQRRESLGDMPVYDITVDNETHSYLVEGGYHVSNCGEIGLYPKHPITGASGWQVCNLTSINLTSCFTEEDFLERCHLASALGTLQASYTNLSFLGKVSEEIIREEALLGVSMTGVFDRLEFINNPRLLRHGARAVKTTNETVANMLGINPSARCTTIKPEGTASLVCMSSSGIHPRHSPEYLRRATYDEGEPVLDIIRRDAPELLEKVYYPSEGGPVFGGYRFITLMESPNKDVTEQTVKALETLEVVKTFKKYWVDEGTNISRCVNETVRHNVSNTIKLDPDEYDAVFEEILAQKDLFNGISVLAKTGDLDYIACPHTHIYQCEEILDMVGEAFMANEYWKVEEELIAKSGLDKMELRKQYNKLWADRCRSFKGKVTWALDEDVAVTHNETVACAGGACEIF